MKCEKRGSRFRRQGRVKTAPNNFSANDDEFPLGRVSRGDVKTVFIAATIKTLYFPDPSKQLRSVHASTSSAFN